MDYAKVWALFFAHVVASENFHHLSTVSQAIAADEMLEEFKKRRDTFIELVEADNELE